MRNAILIAVAALAVTAAHGLAQAPQPRPTNNSPPRTEVKPAAPKADDEAESRVFPLENASAAALMKTLREAFQTPDGRGISFGTDPRTNTIIAFGRPGLLEKAAVLIARLDKPGDANLTKLLDLLDKAQVGEKFDAHRDPALELQQLLISLERRFSTKELPLKFDVDMRAFEDEQLNDVLKFQVGGKIKDAIEGVSLSTYLRKIVSLIPVPSGAVIVVRKSEVAVFVPDFTDASRPKSAQYIVEITTRKFARASHKETTAEPGIETRVFSLKHARAADLAKTLHELLQETDGKLLRCVTDQRTNSIIARGRTDQLETIAFLIDRLDEPVEKKPDEPKKP